MRIILEIYFDTPHIGNIEFEIEFPCRLIDGDSLMIDIIPDENLRKIFKFADHPEVNSTLFDINDNGIFQRVFVDCHDDQLDEHEASLLREYLKDKSK